MKIWCDICKIYILSENRGMAIHERSQIHKKNRQRELDYQQQKARQQKLNQQREQEEQNGVLEQIKQIEERALQAEMNYQKKLDAQKKQEEFIQQQLEQKPREEELPQYNLNPTFEQVPSQFQPKVEQPVYQVQAGRNINIQEQFRVGSVWQLEKDDETGDLYFLNALSNEKKFDKPFGLKLNEADKIRWEQFQKEKKDQESGESQPKVLTNEKIKIADMKLGLTKKEVKKQAQFFGNESESESDAENNLEEKVKEAAQEKVDPIPDSDLKPDNQDKKEMMMIGKWQEVEEEENFFEKYKASSRRQHGSQSDSDSDDGGRGEEGAISQKTKNNTELQQLFEQIESGTLQDEKKIIDVMINQGIESQSTQSVMKQKNDQLKKMIQSNFELPSQLRKPINLKITQKSDLINLHSANAKEEPELADKETEAKFKKRKLNTNKQFLKQSDLDDL